MQVYRGGILIKRGISIGSGFSMLFDLYIIISN